MEKYLKENGWSSFFDTYEDGEQISNVQRKQLMNMVADLIIDTFGFYPDLNEKVMVSKAVVNLFPCLATNPSKCGGTVSIFLIRFHFQIVQNRQLVLINLNLNAFFNTLI